jgi:hypothetical protein
MDQTTQLFVDFQRGLALNGILSDPALEHQVCGDLSAAFQGMHRTQLLRKLNTKSSSFCL